MVDEYVLPNYYGVLVTLNVAVCCIIMLTACLWCKKKEPKNELLGLEGMVKLKNPDEVVIITDLVKSESHVDLNSSTISNSADSEKRASTAAHRSLPDIPVTEANGDTGSELYETVVDKRLLNNASSQDKSPTPSLKKQISVSQHSSISQADDVSSPYSRVKNSPHNYAKVRTTEHPYAQLNAPSTSAAAAVVSVSSSAINSSVQSNSNLAINNPLTLSHDGSMSRQSHHSNSSQNPNDSDSQVEIPAASAIAGMISASQDLPYMTPPIANQHFSGDSQDSSKGYTSISVREPLANILAQQPAKPPAVRNPPLSARDVSDSHYATVSDDSADETYAAIEDPNARHMPSSSAADIYTSGSETYAQIQPMQSIVVAVEINNSSTSVPGAPTNSLNSTVTSEHSSIITIANNSATQLIHRPTSSCSDHPTPVPPPVDSLRAQMHSRQASSSSNNSCSMGNLGSPKPEKRQANSPLPPTPKSSSSALTNSSLASGRNSIISVIELTGTASLESHEAASTNVNVDISPQKKHKSLSPSKDIEGMYAKVMKKAKFSTRNSPSSQNNSPILTRKSHDPTLGLSPLDSAAADLTDVQKIAIFGSNDKSRLRSNSYGAAKDHGYETIPADAMRQNNNSGLENRKSDCYTNILQRERQLETVNAVIVKESSLKAKASYDSESLQKSSQPTSHAINQQSLVSIAYHHEPRSDKHYETIEGAISSNNSDPGYEILLKPSSAAAEADSEKKSDYDPNYEVLKGPNNAAGSSDDGYAKVLEKKRLDLDEDDEGDGADGYSKVRGEDNEEASMAGYSTIGEVKGADANHNYASILETKMSAAVNKLQSEADNESDHYAKIAEAPKALSTTTSPTKFEYSIGSATLTSSVSEKPLTSPTLSSLSTSTMMNRSSSNNLTATTTSTSLNSNMSSHLTPTSSSQYESLTGSDTDPNYESVCYLNSNRENPYERLQPDYSDTQLSSPVTPESKSGNTPNGSTTMTAAILNHSNKSGPKANSPTTTTNNAAATANELVSEIVVDDYFQV